MRWDKLVAVFLPLLVVVEACVPLKEPISNCFVRADNDLWGTHNISAETFLPPKCPVILPNGESRREEYLVDFFGPGTEVSTFHRVDIVQITAEGTNLGGFSFNFTNFQDGTWKARAQGDYFAGFGGFPLFLNPVDSLVALVPLNNGQVARGVAELRYQPGTATFNAPGGTVGVEATLSVTNIADLPGPYTFEWFLDEVSMGSPGSQSSTTYTVSSTGWHRLDALVRGSNGLSIFLSEAAFFNDGPGGCIICGP